MALKIDKGLIKGSLILLIAYNLYNLLNFFFHFAMVRFLSVVEYGILASLYSIIYILAVFTEAIQTVIIKYTTKEQNKGKLKNIIKKLFKKSFFISGFLFISHLLISIPLSFFLEINYYLMAVNGLMIFLAFFTPITRGILQGRKKFKALGINMIVEAVAKLSLALIFIFIGWTVYGAIIGTLIGVLIAFSLSFISLLDVTKSKEEKSDTQGIYNYTKPAFIIIMIIFLFFSIDVIIAKIFFPADIAGAYAISSILAKTIFFGTQPISRAMFPLSAENDSSKKSENIFSNALFILCFVILAALILFYLFPTLIIKIFSGKIIVESISILFYVGIAISLLSLTNLILLYKLSLGKVKGYQYLSIFILIEIILLSIFSSDLLQFSIAFITASAIFLWASIFLMND